ncbi:Protein of unknown function [Cotesia congregata]|uniref:Uncharacterized protein n=1 Tax=Cotesia congregata TaxID=51543 RepID=A0A8J2H5C4_COTCN|nr:Protein of unknown function [Cotesia congregata]
MLPEEVFSRWKTTLDIRYDKQFVKIKTGNIRKLEKLLCLKVRSDTSTQVDSRIFNYTPLVLPEEVKRVLCVDPKFRLTPRRADVHPVTIIKEVEYCVSNLPMMEEDPVAEQEGRNTLISKIVNIILNYYKKPEPKCGDQFRKDVMSIRKFFKEHDEVLVMRADKGNSTVVICWAHKPGCKLRPVVSCIGSPGYKLARFLHTILLSISTTCRYRVKNSLEFVEKVKSLILPPGYIMVSLDVVSLFINIPRSLVLEILDERKRIRDLLVNNNYPCRLINRCLNEYTPVSKKNRNLLINYFRFPFIKDLSPRIDNCIRESFSRLAYYNLLTANYVYSRLKDQIPKIDKSNLIYKVPCSCGYCYIGQTKQRLGDRLRHHRYDCKAINILKENKTALASHYFDTGDQFDFDNTCILHQERNRAKRNFCEMVYIKTNRTINLRSDTQGLSAIYNGILQFCKED